MKTQTRRNKPASIGKTRWAAYATASAATALAGSHSAEAAIHYSGRLDVPFPPHTDYARTFPLDQAGDFIYFARFETGRFANLAYSARNRSAATNPAYFRVYGIASAKFRGFRPYTYYVYVSKLPFGENIRGGPFTSLGVDGSGGFLDRLGYGGSHSQWANRGVGYVGFRFNSGAGIQYGWARVLMKGHPENAFKVRDYAYADPGEPIKAGQISSDEMVPEETDAIVPQEGSLGALAMGAAGVLAWRKSRSRAARLAT